jgi:hypothetical protein
MKEKCLVAGIEVRNERGGSRKQEAESRKQKAERI